MATANSVRDSVSLALVGSGGAGVMTAGGMLLDAAAKSGWYGVMTKSLGPQIRGGESAALLRLATHPTESHSGTFDVLLAIDWKNFDRFAAEIPMSADTLVIADPKGGDLPNAVVAAGCTVVSLPIADILKSVPNGRVNMLSLGAAAAMVEVPLEKVIEVVDQHIGSKGAAAVDSSIAAIRAGAAEIGKLAKPITLAPPAGDKSDRWLISGNEAAGLGAIRGGVRFVAAYPITPATDILEWMSPVLPQVGGALVQAEDELAALNMIIGASFGGVPSLTATSGPGYSLMIESIGLAAAAEVPIVVVDVMRCGPSTGIATKSEQSDLNVAVYGLHGDAPHLVLAPNSIADCALTTQWAVHLAEATQTPTVVLSDQALGQSRAVVNKVADSGLGPDRVVAKEFDENFLRYKNTDSGVSPMSIPGAKGGNYTSEGLTHGEKGSPSTRATDHVAQMDKRRRKLDSVDYGERWADIEGEGDAAIISWGSTAGPIREALMKVDLKGKPVKFISLRLILPTQPEKMAEALKGVKKALVIEQSHSGQFFHYLRAHYDLPKDAQSFRRPGPVPFLPEEIRETIEKWR